MESRNKLLWEDIQPKNLSESGTRVEVHFRKNVTPSYESTEGMINLLQRHYTPLLDLKFLNIYERMDLYSSNLRFIVNDKLVEPGDLTENFNLDKVREFNPERKGKRFGYGVFGVAESEYPISPDFCGVLLSTYGKVIKADLFNQFPGTLGPQLVGVVEIPEFVNFLTIY